jgi:hypothetical protein
MDVAEILQAILGPKLSPDDTSLSLTTPDNVLNIDARQGMNGNNPPVPLFVARPDGVQTNSPTHRLIHS